MQILLAVIDDLFHFAHSALFGVRPAGIIQERIDAPVVNAMQPQLLSLPYAGAPVAAMPDGSFPHIEHVPVGGAVHFIGQNNVALHTDPVMAFDVVSARMSYGEKVHVIKLGGRWAYIRFDEHEGWIFKDALRDKALDVFPSFEEPVQYDAENIETKKLRLCIKDMFCGGTASLFLTDAEYVTYKLYQKNLFLPWNLDRPRTPGTWQKKLRGQQGVHMGVTPHTHSVMEYIVDDIGYVAFVEAVFPDRSIKISSIGLTEEGTYHEEMLSLEQWRELRPVFIEVA